jgi:hypothetical protein
MITNQDITKLSQYFVTIENFDAFKQETYTRFDAVMAELKAMREEMTILTYQQNNLYEKLYSELIKRNHALD